MTTFNFISNKKHFRVLPLLLVFMTAFTTNVWGQSTTYTSGVTLTGGTASTVVISGNNYSGMKIGSGSGGGSLTFSVPSGTTTVYVHAARWSGDGGSISVSTSVGTVSPTSLSVIDDGGISGNGTTYTLSTPTNASSSYFFTLTLTNVTAQATITLSTSAKKQRMVIWGVNASSGGGAVDPTLTYNNGAYTVGSSALDLSTLISASNSSGAITYSVKTDGGTSASIAGNNFTATAAGTCVVTASQAAVTGTYNAKSVDFNVVVTAGGGGGGSGGSCDAFSETWNSCDGTGGNTGGWSGSVASGSIGDLSDNSGWTYSTGYKGDKCIRTDKGGHVTTPSISVTNGSTYTLSYKAADWGTDGCSFAITATGATVTAGSSSGALSQGSWGDYSATLTATASTMQITFTASSGDRGWLDEICVSGNGPIKVTASLIEFTYVLGSGPSATQTFKVQGTDLAGNLTITAPTNYQISTNGSTWNTSITLNKDAGDDVDETTIYVRLISGLAKGEYDGNITFSDGTNDKTLAVEGSVTLSCTTPSISFASATVNKHFGDADFQILPTITGNDLTATVSWSSDKTNCATVAADGTVHIVNATGSGTYVRITATIAAKENDLHTACQNEVSAYYDLYIKNTITWLVSGVPYSEGTPTTEVTEGAKITTAPTDPDGSTACGGKTFMGWTTAEVAVEQSSAPSPLYSRAEVTNVNIEDNVTFYAVFAAEGGESDDTYRKGNLSDLTDGKRVIIVNHSSSKALSSTASTYNLQQATVTFSDSKITSPAAAVVWNVTAGSTGKYFKHGDDYLVVSYDGSSHYNLITSSTSDEWTITDGITSDTYILRSGNYTSYYAENYSGEFKPYTGGSGAAFEMDFYVPAAGHTDYSTTCGPTIKADEVERLTSYKNQTVKSQSITVRGGNLGGATLTADISGADAGLFSCTLASSTITTGAINTTYVISYTPTAFGDAQHTATLRFTDGTTYSDPITLRGRSLPEHFAIVGKAGDNYYVLDGTMTGSAGLVTALPVTVTAGVIDKCPSQAVYTLTERATPDQNVHFVGPTNRRLYGEGSGTGLNTHTGGATDGTGWLLSTTDFETYHITNATSTDHGIMYRSTNDVFGHYMTSNYSVANYYGDLRLLPFTEECTCLNRPVVTRTMKEKQVTISWEAVTGADHYRVTCSNGYDNDAITGTSVTVTGLTGNTTYTFTVQAIASGTDCSLIYSGSFKTAICDDVPYDVLVMPGVKTATIRWKMDEASSATIRFYSDAECNTEISEKALVGVTSPCNVTGLEENTQYYIKIFAGGTCASSAYSLFTQTTEVEVAEWFPDSIRIVLNDVDADAYVLIEDKQENKTTSTNVATGLFFSKYYEAYRSVKLWAVYNGTKEKISLANVKVKSANNGNYWAKDNATGTGAENSQKITSFATFGHYETGYIYPGEEIIVYSDGSDTEDEKIMQCLDDTYGIKYKTDADSLWYLVENQTVSTSGDDGLMLLNGTDTLDVIGGKDAHAAWEKCAKPTWGDDKGWRCNDGKDVEGNTLALSTNRCLLVRKNTVKDGLHAVESNTDNFNTLCEEWWGAHVPVTSDEVQTSCDNFSYVGHYDYDKYYAQFDSVTTVDEIGGKRNPDGTYTIPIPMLDTLSCSMMRVKVYEKDGTEKASREYKVPIMVDDTVAWTTNDTIFHNSKHDAAACAECDVVILKGATLTKTNAGANDVTTIRNLTIYPGGTMVVPNTRTFNVSSVQFRVEGERAPQAKLQGDLITSDQQVIVTRRINNDRYYFFSLPYDCNVSDIRWSNGETPVRGTDYQILEYDAVTRAAEGSTKGAPGHWKNAGNVLHAGVGYNVAVNSKYLKELIFPMAIGQTNLTDKEDNKSTNKVTLAKNVGPTSKNNHNWNLVAHPYVSPFNAYSDAKITAGYLEVEFINDGLDTIWHRKETSNVYLTMPSFAAEKITYEQRLSTGIASMDPFLAVFVQAASEGDLTFAQGSRILSAPSRRWAAKAENEDQSIFVGVTLSGNGQSDQTNLRIRPDFTNEYQLGYDLQKFTTYYTTRPQIYMKPADLQLAFQAVNDDAAKTSFIPVGVYCYKAGTYTFALSEDYPIDEVEAVYLHDATTGETTNLLYDTYTITTDKQLYTNARFSLNVIVNRRAPQVTTDIDVTNAPDNLVRKILINGHVYIQRGAELYDVTGKHMSNL